MEADVAADAALDDLAEGAHQLARLVQADEAGQRLLQHFVLAEPQELGDRLVGDEDLALEVGNEHRVRSIGDDEVGVETIHRENLFRRRTFGRADPAPTARPTRRPSTSSRSEEHTSELQSQSNLVCRLLLEKKKKNTAKIQFCRSRTNTTTI